MTLSEKQKLRRRHRSLRWSRSVVQLLFLGVFFFLFIKTDYSGSDRIQYAVNLLFRIDPLLALCSMIAARVIIASMLFSLIVILLTLVLGRSFCGWVCPMGTLIDLTRPFLFRKKTSGPTMFPRLPFIIMVCVLAAAAVRVPLSGYLDPFSILVRGLSQAAHPGLNYMTESFFTYTYLHAPESVNIITEPIYSLLRATILPFEQKYFDLAILSFLMLGGALLLDLMHRRYFCRNICPLGTLLAFIARFNLLRVKGGNQDCKSCYQCHEICRMGAIDQTRKVDMAHCSFCMDCFEQCPRQVITVQPPISSAENKGDPLLTRRQFLSAVAAGIALKPILEIRTLNLASEPSLIRPPGALAEKDFLQRCVRCAECIQVCIGNGLQPAFLQAGIEGVFTPYLRARTGYCEFNCTLCTQVCPTGALKEITIEEKHRLKIGTAYFDKNRCLPFAKAIPCIVCEEHCPTPDKAIKFRKVPVQDENGNTLLVKQPYIIDELCIGCGICETKCPVSGTSAVLVTSAGEFRAGSDGDPAATSGYG